MGLFILNNNYSYEIVKKCASTFQCQISPLTIVIIHSDGRYEVVRGCHSKFMIANNNPNLTISLSRNTKNCSIHLISSQQVWWSTDMVFKPAYAGMRYCTEEDPPQPKACNSHFVDDGSDPDCDSPAGV